MHEPQADHFATEKQRIALGDPTRAQIVRLLLQASEGRMLVSRLADALNLRQPTVSHHMKALHADGIVVREPVGRVVWYSVAPDHLDRVRSILNVGNPPQSAPNLERIIDDLAVRYRGTFGRETIQQYTRDSATQLRLGATENPPASRVAQFATERLDALVAGSREHHARPEVLFVCVNNAGRSQIAAGILRQLAGEKVTVRTAGSDPISNVRAAVATALDEIGVTLGGEFPKPLTDEAVRAADFVITMGCGDVCPIYPGTHYLDWEIEDPAGLSLEGVRRVRDEIDSRVRELLHQVTND